jgi:hypothetical protein
MIHAYTSTTVVRSESATSESVFFSPIFEKIAVIPPKNEYSIAIISHIKSSSPNLLYFTTFDLFCQVLFGKRKDLGARESFFEEEALLQLHQVARDGGKLFLYYATEERIDIDTIILGRIIPIEGDLSLLTELSSAEGILLMLCRAKFAQDPVEEAHLVIPYSGAIPYSLVS